MSTTDTYGIEDPDYPLTEPCMGRFTARDLVLWALDRAGVPQRDDAGVLLGLGFRVSYLQNACHEAGRS